MCCDQRADGQGVESCIQAAQVNVALLARARGMSVVVKVEIFDSPGWLATDSSRESVAQAHDQFLRIVVDNGGGSGGGDDGIGRIAHVGHKDLTPV